MGKKLNVAQDPYDVLLDHIGELDITRAEAVLRTIAERNAEHRIGAEELGTAKKICELLDRGDRKGAIKLSHDFAVQGVGSVVRKAIDRLCPAGSEAVQPPVQKPPGDNGTRRPPEMQKPAPKPASTRQPQRPIADKPKPPARRPIPPPPPPALSQEKQPPSPRIDALLDKVEERLGQPGLTLDTLRELLCEVPGLGVPTPEQTQRFEALWEGRPTRTQAKNDASANTETAVTSVPEEAAVEPPPPTLPIIPPPVDAATVAKELRPPSPIGYDLSALASMLSPSARTLWNALATLPEPREMHLRDMARLSGGVQEGCVRGCIAEIRRLLEGATTARLETLRQKRYLFTPDTHLSAIRDVPFSAFEKMLTDKASAVWRHARANANRLLRYDEIEPIAGGSAAVRTCMMEIRTMLRATDYAQGVLNTAEREGYALTTTSNVPLAQLAGLDLEEKRAWELLVSNAGKLVTKEALANAVWPGRSWEQDDDAEDAKRVSPPEEIESARERAMDKAAWNVVSRKLQKHVPVGRILVAYGQGYLYLAKPAHVPDLEFDEEMLLLDLLENENADRTPTQLYAAFTERKCKLPQGMLRSLNSLAKKCDAAKFRTIVIRPLHNTFSSAKIKPHEATEEATAADPKALRHLENTRFSALAQERLTQLRQSSGHDDALRHPENAMIGLLLERQGQFVTDEEMRSATGVQTLVRVSKTLNGTLLKHSGLCIRHMTGVGWALLPSGADGRLRKTHARSADAPAESAT